MLCLLGRLSGLQSVGVLLRPHCYTRPSCAEVSGCAPPPPTEGAEPRLHQPDALASAAVASIQ